MLATVLAGIAIGSWLSTPVTSRRRGSLVGVLAVLELLLALAAVASMWLIGQAGSVFAWAGPFSPALRSPTSDRWRLTSIVAIFPAALLMGMAFPVGISLWVSAAGDEHAGARIGIIYAVNVAGAVAGSLAAGFVLLPTIGSRESLLLTSALSLATGLLLLTRFPRPLIGLALGVMAAAVFAAAAWKTPDPVVALLHSRFPREVPVWRREDGHATVAILRRSTPFASTVHGLYINGTHQASDTPTMVGYHRLIGTLPVAIHADPGRALVIGAGGGATAGAVAAFNDGTRVDVVELSPAVVAAARQFSGINQDLFRRPNVRLKVDDGRNHMLLTAEQYDIITADVIVPMHAGAGNLYSVEYLPADAARAGQSRNRHPVDWEHG